MRIPPALILGCSLALAGASTSALGVPATWSTVGDDQPNNYVRALAIDGTDLWVGGEFTQVPFGTPRNRIGTWDGSNWASAGPGVDSGAVYAIQAMPSGDVYAGGNFLSAGSSVSNTRMLARWDGSNWVGIGAGLGPSAEVKAMTRSGSTLYVGGQFYAGAPYLNVEKIAQFDGTSWSAVGTPWNMHGSGRFNQSVNALVVDGAGTVYAGGDFTTDYGAPADYLAKWDGTSWSAVGSGVDGAVNALALDGSDNLYAGGSFTSAGNVALNRVGKWNGSSWSPLGYGMNNSVNALEAVNYCGQTVLYAGGAFSAAGTEPADRIAAWSGDQWSPMGAGLGNSGDVMTLAASGPGILYAGGSFNFQLGFQITGSLGQAQVLNRPCAPSGRRIQAPKRFAELLPPSFPLVGELFLTISRRGGTRRGF
jgi:hypothetical protein